MSDEGNDIVAWFSKHLAPLGMTLGAIGAIPAFYFGFQEIQGEPLFYGMAIAIILLVVLVSTLIILFRKSRVKSPVLDQHGKEIYNSIPYYSRWMHLAAGLILFATLGLAGCYGGWISKQRVNEYYFGIVDVENINWIGGGSQAIANGTEYDFVRIADENEVDVRILDGYAAVISFDVLMRSRLKFLRLDSLQIEVTDFKECPTFEQVKAYAAVRKPELFVAEIDDPKVSGKTSYLAAYVSENGKHDPTNLESLGKIGIESNEPQEILLRILAKRQGIYTIKCIAQFSSGTDKQSKTLFDNKVFLFGKLKQPLYVDPMTGEPTNKSVPDDPPTR